MTPKRKRWMFGIVTAVLLLIVALTAAARIPFSSDILRKRLVDTLSDRLDADVELGELTLRALPSLHAEGTNLTVRFRGRTDVPPLISIQGFTADASLINIWRKHASHVKLDGLVIQIPPDLDEGQAESPARHLPGTPRVPGTVGTAGKRRDHLIHGQQVTIDELIADRAELFIIPKERGKEPKAWHMHTLRMKNVSANTKMPFESQLTNAVPPGEIDTEGSFGPWHRDDPGHTPIDGRFTFKKADLGFFKGISGTLSAKGTYAGSLDTLGVHGETDTPNFAVDVSGHPVPLHTKYHAIVDGTNGDTRLEQIDASFLNTSFTAKGGVFDVKGVKGRQVVLDIAMNKARLEDIMRLAVKSTQAPMTGALQLTTRFVLPPGDEDVIQRLRLDGRFSINSGGFTDAGVQTKINDMSRRASGGLADAPPQSAAPRVGSDFQGRFILANGVLQLPTLVFDIPGAAVKLAGSYSLGREAINFSGNLYMDAKVSQTVTGWKSMLLKVADPLFRENGQTVVPIQITGTRSAPEFGLDRGRVFKR